MSKLCELVQFYRPASLVYENIKRYHVSTISKAGFTPPPHISPDLHPLKVSKTETVFGFRCSHTLLARSPIPLAQTLLTSAQVPTLRELRPPRTPIFQGFRALHS